MSKTDGEDTQRIEKEAITFADSIEVNSIATHTGLVKGYITGAKELASLREQLAKKDEDAIQAIDALTKQIAELMHQLKQKDLEAKYWLTQSKTLQSDLKQKEDENRELKDLNKELYSWLTIVASHIPEENFEEVKQSISRLSAKLGKSS